MNERKGKIIMRLACRRKNRVLFLTYMQYIFIPYWNSIGYKLKGATRCTIDLSYKLGRLKENTLNILFNSKYDYQLINWFINHEDSKYLYGDGLIYQVRNRAKDCRYYTLKHIPIPFCNYYKLIEQRWVDIKNPKYGINSYSLGVQKMVDEDFNIAELIEQHKVLFEGNINTYRKVKEFMKVYKESYISAYEENEL